MYILMTFQWTVPNTTSNGRLLIIAIISLIKLHFVLLQLIWRISSFAMLSIRFFFSKIYPYNSLNMTDTWVINAYIFSTFKQKYNIFVDVFLCFKYVHRTNVIFYFHFNDKNIKKKFQTKAVLQYFNQPVFGNHVNLVL